jgi:hypothetical protein
MSSHLKLLQSGVPHSCEGQVRRKINENPRKSEQLQSIHLAVFFPQLSEYYEQMAERIGTLSV